MDNSGLLDRAAARFGLHISAARLLAKLLRGPVAPLGLGMFVWALWGALIAYAARIDGVDWMEGTGRGLWEHYGYLACYASGPLVALNAYLAYSYFRRLLRDIGQYVDPSVEAGEIAEILHSHVRSLGLGTRPSKFMLAMFCLVGLLFTIADIAQLNDPMSYWGNDVFNAEAYPFAWIAANSYLLVLWAIVYPVALFYVFHIAISGQIIVARLSKRGMLRLNFLHVDGCGGMARFGNLNLLLMLVYGWMAVAGGFLLITHRSQYLSLTVGGFALSALFLVHSVMGIYSVTRAVRRQRDDAVSSLNGRIRRMLDGKPQSFAGALATLQYRDRVLAVASFPYARGAAAAVNLLRYGPGLASLANFLMYPPLAHVRL